MAKADSAKANDTASDTRARDTTTSDMTAKDMTAKDMTAKDMTASDATAKDKAAQLGSAEPFSRLGRRALRALGASAKTVEHAEGRLIVEEGGTPLGFHLITEGEAVVEVAGKERRRLGPGESFGLISVIDGKPRSATVRTVTPLRTLFIAPWVFHPLLASEPAIAQDLLPALCAMLRDAEQRD